MDGPEERVGKLVVTCSDRPETLEFAEEPLDEVTFAIEGEVGFALYASAGIVWYDRSDAAFVQGLDQGVGVVSLVGEERVRFDLFEQGCCLGQIMGLARSERQGDRIAQSVDDGVDFRRQPASGSSDGLIAAVFFRAPALC
jgi:hypothetical protein